LPRTIGNKVPKRRGKRMDEREPEVTRGRAGEVFAAFFRLGLTSFGGPIAHLGYFHNEFVQRRAWLDERAYADLVALCQFLPGPASSQVGFALGLLRAGPLGALAAFVAFTLPSAVALVLFAYGSAVLEGPIARGAIDGLKIVAVAIVAQAVWGMARTLCPDRERAVIALGAMTIVALLAGALGQIAAIVAGAVAGIALVRNGPAQSAAPMRFPVSPAAGLAALGLFGAFLLGLPLLVATWPGQGLALFDAFYRAGALVFGGGHVVLPLLEAETVARGWITADSFLAGYGAAQAVPGPLFTFPAYLGAAIGPEPNGVPGALIALAAIFLPGFLLLLGAMPFWDAFRTRTWAQAIMAGANAAVVGILAAALYDPVFTSAVTSPLAFVLAAAGFVVLTVFKMPPWIVVLLTALGGIAVGMISG